MTQILVRSLRMDTSYRQKVKVFSHHNGLVGSTRNS